MKAIQTLLRARLLLAAAMAVGLWTSTAMAVQQQTPVVVFSTDSINLTSSDVAQNFTLTIYAANDQSNPNITFAGYDAGINISPGIPAGQIKVMGVSYPDTASLNPFCNLSSGNSLTNTIFVSGSSGNNTVTLDSGDTIELAQFNLQLQPGAALNKYDLSFFFTDLTDADGNSAADVTATDGFIATPEPTSLGLMLGLEAQLPSAAAAARCDL